MKKHSELGGALLNEVPANPDDPLVAVAYGICRWHHERWDGGGYPDGLAGDEIPILRRLLRWQMFMMRSPVYAATKTQYRMIRL